METQTETWEGDTEAATPLMYMCVIYVTIRDHCKLIFFIMVALSNLDQDLEVTLDYFYNSGDV
jgi:hypothetical protein